MFGFLKKLKDFRMGFVRGLWFLGINIFWVILILFFISLAAGQLMFSFYSGKIQQPSNGSAAIKFREDLYQKFMEKRQLEEMLLKEFLSQNYQNPFQ